MKNIFILIGLLFNTAIYSQCSPSGLISQKEFYFCQPGAQTIQYSLRPFKEILFEETFNCGGVCDTNLIAFDSPIGIGNFQNPILPSPTNDIYFSTTTVPYTRAISVGPFDLTSNISANPSSVNLSFDFTFASPSGVGPQNGPDLAHEGLQFQYSSDGINWIDYRYYSISGDTGVSIATTPFNICGNCTGGPSLASDQWNEICINIPSTLLNSNMHFRWIQLNYSGIASDHWAIDNIEISKNIFSNNFTLVNNNTNLGTGPIDDSIIISTDTNIVFESNYVSLTTLNQTFYDTIKVRFITPDSIFLVNKSNPTYCNYYTFEYFTIGGLEPFVNYELLLNGISHNFSTSTTTYRKSFISQDDYTVSVNRLGNCNSNILNISTRPNTPTPNLVVTDPIYEGQNLVLSTDTIADVYLWKDSSMLNFYQDSSTIVFNNVSIADSNIYCLRIHKNNCLSTTVCDTVKILPFNEKPIAINDTIITNEDILIDIAVLINDFDLNGFIDSSSVTIIQNPLIGNTINGSLGIIQYQPNLNIYGLDSFIYFVCDNGIPSIPRCDTATVYVTIIPVNDNPIANNDSFSTFKNVPTQINVIANDNDYIDQSSIDMTSVSIVQNTSNATTTVNLITGIITYSPVIGFFGLDSFNYRVCDLGYPVPARCDTATTYMNVLDTTVNGIISTSLANPLQNSKVYLIDYLNTNDSIFVIDSTYTDNLGYYNFNNVSQGVYIKAIPNLANYPNEIPSYYSGTAFFQSVTVINQTVPAINYNFSTVGGVNPGGNGFIGGIVANGAGKNNETLNPVAYLNLLLVDENNLIVEHTTTNIDGSFSFEDILITNYSIWVDKAGILNNLAPNISLSSIPVQDKLEFILHTDYLELKLNVSINSIESANFQIFPNPTNDVINLNLSTLKNQTSIEILDVIGNKVYQSKIVELKSKFNLEELKLSKGIYFIKVIQDNKSQLAKIVFK